MHCRPRRSIAALLACSLLLSLAAGCGGGGDGGPAAPPPPPATARRFQQIADSLRAAGDPDGAATVAGLADLVRRVDQLREITVTVDGAPVTFRAVALEVTTRPGACDADPDPALCRDAYPPYALDFVAWRDDDLSEGFFGFADAPGTASVAPDPTTGADAPAGLLYFRRERGFQAGEYRHFLADARVWIADDGTVSAERAVPGAACSAVAARDLLPGGSYTCHHADVAAALQVTAAEDRPDGGTPTRRSLDVARQQLAALVVDVSAAPRSDAPLVLRDGGVTPLPLRHLTAPSAARRRR